MTNGSNSALRPTDWDSYVGQERMKMRLRISIRSALKRDQPLGHTLLVGPPGFGKTSLAALIAEELMEEFHSFVMPLKIKALQEIFLQREGVIFLDEIHRMRPHDQEWLQFVLEDGEVHFEDGKKIKIPANITIIAATTRLEKVIEPVRDRFRHKPAFEEYTDEDMAKIIIRMGSSLGLKIPGNDAKALGRASAGVPRQARNLVEAVQDLGSSSPERVLGFTGITEDGLTEDHVKYLHALRKVGDRAGIDKLSNFTGQPKDVIVNLEKLLLRKDFIEYTQKGRVLSIKGFDFVEEDPLT